MENPTQNASYTGPTVSFPNFVEFKKIPRLSRDIVITEKIDGTNGVIFIDSNKEIFAGSRNRWLWGSIQNEIHNDNHGFANWVRSNKEGLLQLGPGFHYGEWMGKGIQRGYGLEEKRFYLFNVHKWAKLSEQNNVLRNKKQQWCPECCHVVPILYSGIMDINIIRIQLELLQNCGSIAIPGFMKPEGVVIFHTASGQLFKKTIENDEKGKEQ